jgi:hypothetical protein
MKRRGGRVVEGAGFEIQFGGNSNEGSNPSSSAIIEDSQFVNKEGWPSGRRRMIGIHV